MRPSKVDDGVVTAALARYRPSPAPKASFTIAVLDGAGERIVVDGTHPTAVLVGQSPACDLRVSDPAVSRRHAAFEIVGERLKVTDLGSTNGTYVGSLAVAEAFLNGGETVRLGATPLSIERGPLTKSPPLEPVTSFGNVVGWSREMRRLYPLCRRLAAADVPVIIEGRTGTGKEALAEAIHEQGPRAAGPFIVFDCTAVPPSLVESELFGHERGAFTGAVSRRRGVFEQAHGGTLLIDEIGDLEPSLQPKLLRAIERSEIKRVGGDETIKVDVRLLAATRRDLDREVQAGRFRDDLFHRLAVARIELPSLAQRKGDIELLARHFAKSLGGTEASLPADVLRRWEEHGWPGNVRELRNAVARYLALGELAPVTASAAAGSPESHEADDPIARVLRLRLPLAVARERVVDELERRYVETVLAEHGGNVSRAAAASGIGRRYFHRLKARTADKGDSEI